MNLNSLFLKYFKWIDNESFEDRETGEVFKVQKQE